MPQIRKILVPVDFSACSRAALDWAAQLAAKFEATIDVLHTWDTPPYVGPEVIIHVAGETQQTLAQLGRQHAEKEMQHFLKSVEQPGVVRGRIEIGDPVDTIVRLAGEGYDLIVMGTHGRGGITHILLGSVAEKVVRRAPCPVMTIRVPGAEEASG
jgi:universal stress protein A